MFSMSSELTPRASIPDTRIPQLMQPCLRTSYTIPFFMDFHVFRGGALEISQCLLENPKMTLANMH